MLNKEKGRFPFRKSCTCWNGNIDILCPEERGFGVSEIPTYFLDVSTGKKA